jgi:hypothetical protein
MCYTVRVSLFGLVCFEGQDLITITHCFSSRLYGLRNYRKVLQKALKDDQRTQNQAPSDF